MARTLRRQGYPVGRKRVSRLMRLMALLSVAPGPNTSPQAPDASDLPLPAQRPPHRRAQPGLVQMSPTFHWHTRHVLSWQSVDHSGYELLSGSAGRRLGAIWKAGDLQHRSRQPIHQPGLDGHAESLRHSDLHRWQGPLARQRLHRAAMAFAQAGVCVPQCLRLGARLPSWHRRMEVHSNTEMSLNEAGC